MAASSCMPLLNTQFRIDSALFKTRLTSHLEKCYQYYPLSRSFPLLVCVILQTITENLETWPWIVLASIDCRSGQCFLLNWHWFTHWWLCFYCICWQCSLWYDVSIGNQEFDVYIFMYCVCGCQLLSFPEPLHLCNSTTIKWTMQSNPYVVMSNDIILSQEEVFLYQVSGYKISKANEVCTQ